MDCCLRKGKRKLIQKSHSDKVYEIRDEIEKFIKFIDGIKKAKNNTD